MWLKLYNDNRTIEGFAFLIANKIDLEYREINTVEGKKKAEQLGIPYCEISAKSGENIQDLFQKLIDVVEKKVVDFDMSKKKESEMIKEEEENVREEDTEVKEPKIIKQDVVENAGKEHNVVLKNQPKNKNKEEGENKKNCC